MGCKESNQTNKQKTVLIQVSSVFHSHDKPLLVISPLYEMKIRNSYIVCVDALRPSQQFFSHVGMCSCVPGLNLGYLAEDKVSLLKNITQCRL